GFALKNPLPSTIVREEDNCIIISDYHSKKKSYSNMDPMLFAGLKDPHAVGLFKEHIAKEWFWFLTSCKSLSRNGINSACIIFYFYMHGELLLFSLFLYVFELKLIKNRRTSIYLHATVVCTEGIIQILSLWKDKDTKEKDKLG
ncbi:hypothetical protein ACJX0J_029433, partial [Zea mays]